MSADGERDQAQRRLDERRALLESVRTRTGGEWQRRRDTVRREIADLERKTGEAR